MNKVPQKEQIHILCAIKALSENPYPHGHKKLVGENITFRIRIGNYRVIYDIYDGELFIEVIRIRHRKDAYQ